MLTHAELGDIYSHLSQSFLVSSLAILSTWIIFVIPLKVLFRRRWADSIGPLGDLFIFLFLCGVSIFFSLLAHCMRDFGFLGLLVQLLQYFPGLGGG